METKFQPTNDTPLAALTIGQFRDLMETVIQPQQPDIQLLSNYQPETFGKKECSELTGYKINTINKMICEKTIPFYKLNARVIFKREEIKEWMLSNRVKTVNEYIAEKENSFFKSKLKR